MRENSWYSYGGAITIDVEHERIVTRVGGKFTTNQYQSHMVAAAMAGNGAQFL